MVHQIASRCRPTRPERDPRGSDPTRPDPRAPARRSTRPTSKGNGSKSLAGSAGEPRHDASKNSRSRRFAAPRTRAPLQRSACALRGGLLREGGRCALAVEHAARWMRRGVRRAQPRRRRGARAWRRCRRRGTGSPACAAARARCDAARARRCAPERSRLRALQPRIAAPARRLGRRSVVSGTCCARTPHAALPGRSAHRTPRLGLSRLARARLSCGLST